MVMAHKMPVRLQAGLSKYSIIRKLLHKGLQVAHTLDTRHNQEEDIHHYRAANPFRIQAVIPHKFLSIISPARHTLKFL